LYLAACAYQREQLPVVLDADNERSALEWAAGGGLPFPVNAANKDGLARQARLLVGEGHTVIIDGPPNSRDVLWAASAVADRVIVPVAPTGLDINRLRSTLEVLLDIEETKGELDTRILLTRWDQRKLLAREALELLKDFPIVSSKVRALTRYENSFGSMPDYLEEYGQVWEEITHDKA
jgi:chromosome partitioning protein